jgi:hypothetical protein
VPDRSVRTILRMCCGWLRRCVTIAKRTPATAGITAAPLLREIWTPPLLWSFSVFYHPLEEASWLDPREFPSLRELSIGQSKPDRCWPDKVASSYPDEGSRSDRLRDLWKPDFALVHRTAERLGLPVLDEEVVHSLLSSLVYRVSPLGGYRLSRMPDIRRDICTAQVLPDTCVERPLCGHLVKRYPTFVKVDYPDDEEEEEDKEEEEDSEEEEEESEEDEDRGCIYGNGSWNRTKEMEFRLAVRAKGAKPEPLSHVGEHAGMTAEGTTRSTVTTNEGTTEGVTLLTLADVKPAVEAWAIRAAVGTTWVDGCVVRCFVFQG